VLGTAVLAVAISGCGQGAFSPTPSQVSRFVTLARTVDPALSSVTKPALSKSGVLACDQLDRGRSVKVVAALMGIAIPVRAVVGILAAAGVVYCPGHGHAIAEWISTSKP
jgi:hypothetical protein